MRNYSACMPASDGTNVCRLRYVTANTSYWRDTMEPESDNSVESAFQRRSSPDALMNLILRFETASGPRTVIACSVPRHVAAEIADVMHSAGQHAEFVDRYSPLSVSDHLLMREIDQVRRQETEGPRSDWAAAISPRMSKVMSQRANKVA